MRNLPLIVASIGISASLLAHALITAHSIASAQSSTSQSGRLCADNQTGAVTLGTAGQSCSDGQSSIDINSKGERGDPGPPRPPGPRGATGTQTLLVETPPQPVQSVVSFSRFDRTSRSAGSAGTPGTAGVAWTDCPAGMPGALNAGNIYQLSAASTKQCNGVTFCITDQSVSCTNQDLAIGGGANTQTFGLGTAANLMGSFPKGPNAWEAVANEGSNATPTLTLVVWVILRPGLKGRKWLRSDHRRAATQGEAEPSSASPRHVRDHTTRPPLYRASTSR
jgi:hypothetical protein